MNDLAIRGARVLDGTGAPAFDADIAVRGGRIAAVGRALGPARRELAAEGLTVAPGFIDMHVHDDLFLLRSPGSAHRIRQGVTAAISGNCGFSPFPEPSYAFREYARPVLGEWPDGARFAGMAEYLDALERTPLRHHAGALAGCGAMRAAVKGYNPGPLTDTEMDRMLRLVRSSLDEGALGLSWGLMYVPEAFSTTGELVRVASVAAERRRPVMVHIRSEGKFLLPSIDEMIEVARRSGAAVHISHLKAAGRGNWDGALDEVIARLERARAQGLDMTADAYPYDAGSTTLLSLLPPWALAGGVEEMVRRLRGDRLSAARVSAALKEPGEDWDNLALSTGWDRVTVSFLPDEGGALIGKTIAEIAGETGDDPADCALRLAVRFGGAAGIVVRHMLPADVDRAVAWPPACVISDSIYSEEGNPHPRLYGTYGRLLGDFARDRQVLPLAEAIRKCTWLPARRLGLSDRGTVAEGMAADLTIFNADTIADQASYEDPRRYPEGIRGVIAGGGVALWDGQPEPGRFGRALRAR